MADTIVPAAPTAGMPVGTVAVFLTLGAALVALYPSGGATDYGRPTFKWLCLGCGEHNHYNEQRSKARNWANDHAGSCRAVPWPQSKQC